MLAGDAFDPTSLQRLKSNEKCQCNILVSLRELLLRIAPNAKEEIKYGGLVFLSDKRLFCGIFIRKNHISVEFDRGAEMQDPDNSLEGGGTNRRHLKILQKEDIENKKTEYYIRQSFAL